MRKKILLCMTSNFLYDQRMQRIAHTLDKKYDVTILNRYCAEYAPYSIINIHSRFKSGIFFYADFNMKMAQYIRKNHFDIIYFVDADTLIAANILRSKLQATWVYDSHEWFSEVIELQGKPLKKMIWKSIERWAIKKMDICFTVNESLAKLFSNFHQKTFISIKNVPFLRQRNEFESETKILLYQGAVNEGRGLESLISSMPFLEGYALHIYGNGDIKEKILALIQEQNLEDSVKCMNAVSPDQLWDVTCSAYIGLNLLENSSQSYYYSLANKFFDYIHAALPSIHMAYPEYISIMEKYSVGKCISSLDANEIIEAIKYLSNIEVRQECIKACTKARMEMNWEQEEIKLLQAFDGL